VRNPCVLTCSIYWLPSTEYRSTRSEPWLRDKDNVYNTVFIYLKANRHYRNQATTYKFPTHLPVHSTSRSLCNSLYAFVKIFRHVSLTLDTQTGWAMRIRIFTHPSRSYGRIRMSLQSMCPHSHMLSLKLSLVGCKRC
jgi:hypothetical protein